MPRDVWVLSLVAFLVAVGFGVVVPVLPVFARTFGATQFQVGAVVSAFALMRFVTSPACGRINAAIGERVALGIGIGIVALSTLGVGFASSYPQMLLFRGAGGIGSAMFSVAAMTLLLASVDTTRRGRASALYSGGFLLGGMAGPAVGGLLAGISLRAPFFFYAFTLVLAGAAGLILLNVHSVSDSKDTSGSMTFRDAFAQARYRVACTANFAAGWQAQGARSTLIPIFVVEVLDRPTSWTGIAFAVSAVVQGLTLEPVGRISDTVGRKPVLVTGLALGGLATLAMPLAPNIVWLTLALCVFGVGSAALSTAPTAIVGDVTKGTGGTPVAAFQMFSDFGSILGPLAVGAIADHFPLVTAFALGAILMLVVSGWSLGVRVDPEPERTR